jgi:hypothetical protein
MIRLDSTLRRVQILLGGAVASTQPDVVVCYTDRNTPAPAPFLTSTKLSVTNNGTAVDICDAPANLVTRDIDFISVRNNDSASVTVTIRYNDNGTTYKIIAVTLLTLESLLYESGAGWKTLDASGNSKSATASAAGPSWTPVASFATPGDSVFTPSIQVGDSSKVDREIRASFRYVGTVAHTTAAGNLQITGIPYVPATDANFIWDAACVFSGITKAGYGSVCASLTSGSSIITFSISGSAVAVATVGTGDVPTGGTLILRASLRYRT